MLVDDQQLLVQQEVYRDPSQFFLEEEQVSFSDPSTQNEKDEIQ